MKARERLSASCRSVLPPFRDSPTRHVVALLAALVAAAPLSAATIIVYSAADSGGTCPGATCTLRQAIASAAPGDFIGLDFDAIRTIDLKSGLSIDKSLTIGGAGPAWHTVQRSLDAPTSFGIFAIQSGEFEVKIANLTISGGNGTFGGISNSSNFPVTIDTCLIRANNGTVAGGIASHGSGGLTIANSTISENSGSGIYTDGSGAVTIVQSTIAGNSAPASGQVSHGGGIYNNGTPITIISSTIAANVATNGGGVSVSSGAVSVRNTIIAKNSAAVAPDFEGALDSLGYNLIGDASGATITGTTTGNQLNVDPLLGPLIDSDEVVPTMALLPGSPAIDKGHSSGYHSDQRGRPRPVNSPAIADAAGGDGSDIGAFEVQAYQLPGCQSGYVVTNNADSGPGSLRAAIGSLCGGEAIAFDSSVTQITLTSGELLVGRSGFIYKSPDRPMTIQRSGVAGTPEFRLFNIAPGADVALIHFVITNGYLAAEDGGGILVQSGARLQLNDSTLVGNAARNGGGLSNEGTTAIFASTIEGNSSTLCGGGLHIGAGKLIALNSTIAGNTSAGSGGGLCNEGSLDLANSTVAANVAISNEGRGGGLANLAGIASATNTIIAANAARAAPDIHGALTSRGFNLIGNNMDSAITPNMASDLVGTAEAPIDPRLAPLRNNGGPTRTMALLPDSPAIDKGESGKRPDQRYFSRPIDLPEVSNPTGGDGSDIGAFEFGDLDIDSNGAYDALSDGLLILRYLFGIEGAALTDSAIGPSAARADPASVVSYLATLQAMLDVDGNSKVDALTDGLILIRFLFGLRGPALIKDVLGTGATRDASQIEAYIRSLMLQ